MWPFKKKKIIINVDADWDRLEPTASMRGQPQPSSAEKDGFINWFRRDISHGFHIYTDDELAHELQYKAKLCYPEPDVIKMFFYRKSSDQNIEVDYNVPYHEKLAEELSKIPATGPKRDRALARIRYAAKKIGMKSVRNTKGKTALATDISVVWRDTQGNICG